MSAAVDVTVLVEVDKVDQQLDTDDADETRRVPAHIVSSSTRKDRQLATPHWLSTLCISNSSISSSSIAITTSLTVRQLP